MDGTWNERPRPIIGPQHVCIWLMVITFKKVVLQFLVSGGWKVRPRYQFKKPCSTRIGRRSKLIVQVDLRARPSRKSGPSGSPTSSFPNRPDPPKEIFVTVFRNKRYGDLSQRAGLWRSPKRVRRDVSLHHRPPQDDGPLSNSRVGHDQAVRSQKNILL